MSGPWGQTRRGIFVPMPTVILFVSAVKVAPTSPHGLFLEPSTNGSSIVRPTAWAVEMSDLPFRLQCWQLVSSVMATLHGEQQLLDLHLFLFFLTASTQGYVCSASVTILPLDRKQ